MNLTFSFFKEILIILMLFGCQNKSGNKMLNEFKKINIFENKLSNLNILNKKTVWLQLIVTKIVL